MQTIKKKRLESLLKEQLSYIFLYQELSDPRIDSLISVLSVSVASDLSTAKVYIAHPFKDIEALELVAILNKAGGFVQTCLSRRLSIRRIPQLSFYLDDSYRKMQRIQEILTKE